MRPDGKLQSRKPSPWVIVGYSYTGTFLSAAEKFVDADSRNHHILVSFVMPALTIRPVLWLLERYHHPYFLVYTNTPGEIVYEDHYQICAKTDGFLQIDEVQPSWAPKDTESDA